MSLTLDTAIPYPDEENSALLSYAGCADLEALHIEFYDRLVRLCTQRLRDHCLAEDVAHDTILRARRFWNSKDVERPTWPWLKTIAIRLCLDAGRDRSRELFPGTIPEQADAIDRTERLLDKLTIRSAMASLPERQRLALQLRYLDDRDRDSSAEALGINVNAFDQLLNRARLRLARLLDPTGSAGPLAGILVPVRWLRRRLHTAWPHRWAASGFAPMSAGDAPFLMSAAACLVCVAMLPTIPKHIAAPAQPIAVTRSYAVPSAARSTSHPTKVMPSANASRVGKVVVSSTGPKRPPAPTEPPGRKHTSINVIEHPPAQTQTRICVGVLFTVPTVCLATPHTGDSRPTSPAESGVLDAVPN